MTLRIFGDSRSGNCLKVKWTARRLGVAYDWQEVDVMSGRTRTKAFLRLNPAGQVPAVVLDDGRPLAQSNAIMLYLAEGSDLIPPDRYQRARMHEWLFWEQYSHEPTIAVARFRLLFQGQAASELDPALVQRGEAALKRLELGLQGRRWLAGEGPTLADVALVAYTRWAHEGGFSLEPYPAIRAWIERCEDAFAISEPRDTDMTR
jgi:glutathione S-transferase